MAGSAVTSILSLSISDLSQALRNKTFSITQVVEQVLSQQNVMNDLNALISSAPMKRLQSRTLKAQQRQDRGQLQGSLDGVPIVVKDNYCTSWARTTCASNMLRDYTPPYDATLVSRLEQAGAIIIGKSNMDEFGMGSGGVNSAFGPTKNLFRSGKPYTLTGGLHECGALPDGVWLASGGSSGGSAVAVASGMAYCGLGSDTGGSVRAPAAFCGLVGLKPSYGALSRAGLVSLVNSMDCPGVLARTCDDCAAVMAALTGTDQADSTSVSVSFPPSPLSSGSVDGLVVGVPQEYHCPGLHPQILQQWRQLADILSDAGAEVVRVSLPHTPYAPSCYSVLNTAEVASNFTRYTGVEFGLRVPCSHSMEAQFALSRSAGLSQVVRDRVLAGNYFLLRDNRDRYLMHAMKVRRLILEDFLRLWSSGVDVLLTPTTLFPAPRPDLYNGKQYSELTYLQDLCTSPANLAGLPALSLPVGYTTNGGVRGRDRTSAEGNGRREWDCGRDGGSDGSLGRRVGSFNDGGDEKCDMSELDVVGPDHRIEGLPLALQLIGPHGSDRRLLEIGKWIELTLNIPRIELKDPL